MEAANWTMKVTMASLDKELADIEWKLHNDTKLRFRDSNN